MNISFVNNQYRLGGAETVVRQLHEGLATAGHRTWLYVALGKDYPWEAGVRPLYPRLLSRLDHSRWHGLAERFFPRPAWTDSNFRKLTQSPADIIHVHSFHGDYAGLESLAYVAKTKPVVWTFHRFWGVTGGCDHPGDCRRYLESCGQCPRVNEWPICGTDNTREQLKLKKETIARAPITVVSPSHHLAGVVRQSPIGKAWRVEVIPNGVDPQQFGFARKRDPHFRRSLGLSENGLIVLVVIRDFKDGLKGFDTIKRALEQLPAASDVTFCFAGQNAAWAIGQCPTRFRYADFGYVSDRLRLAQLFEAVDVFLFASPGENFPCVILEAMSAGCCVVSTPTDGVLEQIEDRVSGLLAESFQPEDLAKALAFALEHPDEVRTFSVSARRRVAAEFSEKAMIDRHIALYQEILGKG